MGGQLGVKGLRLLQQSCFVQLLIFSLIAHSCNALSWTQAYEKRQLEALQVVWGAWGTNTPNLESNLAGWSSSQPIPCNQGVTEFQPNWRGVQCLTNINCHVDNVTTGHENCSAFITGLTLNDASIAGILPPQIGDIATLLTLELTGNPNLTGNLPLELRNTHLVNIDLHDNAFHGEIPNFEMSLRFPLKLDLSGNRFSGSSPLSKIRGMEYLQILNLGRNNLEGEISESAFGGMTQLVQLDLSNNRFNGTLPTLTMIKNLQILKLSNNSFRGPLPNLTTMSSLHTVDLSNNKFYGTLPTLALFKSLQILNLSRNALSGSIWFSLASISTENNTLSVLDLSHNELAGVLVFRTSSKLGFLQQLYLDHNLVNGTLDINELSANGFLNTKSPNSSGLLRVLSLMNNSISNVVYDVKNIEDITTVIRLQGNPYCEFPDSNDRTRCFCKQICFNSGPMKNDKRKVVIIAVVTSAISVLLMISLAALVYRNRRYKRYLQLQFQRQFDEFEVKPTIFPYNQLRTATRDFHIDMMLGKGGFGAVYKGILSNGNVVAVKQLFAKTNQGVDDFLNEVVSLTGMKHRNLVNLKGCCIREQQRLLVYEYVDNYDIDKILLAGPNKALVSWPDRLKICLGVARGLHYLHALAQPKIVHRDIKPSNILLTKTYEAKIADFGLALLFPEEKSCIMMEDVAGTLGYLAPEYLAYGELSDKVDIFSFGVLCLQVVSGRGNCNLDETLPPNERYLSKWAWELHRRSNLMGLVDPTISPQGDEKLEVQRVINIALLCIQHEAQQRPSMERVVAMLQGDSEWDQAVVVNPGNEEQYEISEGSELSFMDSSRRAAGCWEDDL